MIGGNDLRKDSFAPRLNLAFASGMSSLSDLQGAIKARVPVGVVATALTTAQTILSLPRYLDSGGHVFVDSGAFTAERTGVPPNWERVLRCYENLVGMTIHPENLHVVAPDKVGDQHETLRLIAQHKDRIGALIKTGARVIVPLQVGAKTSQAMLDAIASTLGTREFVAGIPSNKAAMSIEECSLLKHSTFHILGRVQRNADQAQRIDALLTSNPDAVINADANWLRSRIRLVSAMRPACSTHPLIHPRVDAVARALEADRYLELSAGLR